MNGSDEPEILEDEPEIEDPMGPGAGRSLEPGLVPVRMPAAEIAGRDLLGRYLAELRRHPLLTPEEEREAAVAYYEKGDRKAGERLVTANLRLVVKLAFQYHRQWSNVLDLIQEGNVGLVQALSRYDPYRGIRFSSYAQYWIRAMILRFLMDNYRLVRLGSTRAARQLFFQLRKERERLLKEGLTPHPPLIGERLHVAESEVIAVDQQMRAPALSIDAPLGTENDGRTLGDVIADEQGRSPESDVARGQMGGRVQRALDRFAAGLHDERERVIWEERLVAQDPVSLSVLGERFGVSKERIRQIEVRIRSQLRVFLRQELGDDIDFEFAPRDG